MSKRFSRTFLMVAGIFTVMVIVLTQSFYVPVSKIAVSENVAKEKKAKTEKNFTISPSDVVPSPAVQLDKNTPPLISEFIPEETPEKIFLPLKKTFFSFFTALLRATISPNAP